MNSGTTSDTYPISYTDSVSTNRVTYTTGTGTSSTNGTYSPWYSFYRFIDIRIQNHYLHKQIKKGYTKLIQAQNGKRISISEISVISESQSDWVNLYFIVPRNKEIYVVGVPRNPYVWKNEYLSRPIITDKTVFVKSDGDAILGLVYAYI